MDKNKGLFFLAILIGVFIFAISGLTLYFEFSEKIPDLRVEEAKMEEEKFREEEDKFESDSVVQKTHSIFFISGHSTPQKKEEASSEESSEGTSTEESDEEAEEEEEVNNDYIWEDSSEVALTEENYYDIISQISTPLPEGRTIERMIINEIFAKHGSEFKSKDLKKFFNQRPWYKKIKKKVDQNKAYAKMSQLEKDNIEFLKGKE